MFDPVVLKIARQLRLKSRADLARAAGVTAQAVGGFERGKFPPGPDTLAKIAKCLDLPVDYFDRPRPADRLTSTEIREIVVRTRLEQGLPPRVSDPQILDAIAALVTGRPREKAAS